MKINTETKSVLLLIAVAAIWGSAFLLIKKALLVYSPVQVGMLRVIVGGMLTLPFSLYFFYQQKKTTKKSNPDNRLLRRYLLLAVVGLTGSFVPAMLFGLAITEIASSLASVLNALTSLFTVLIALLFYKYRAKKAQFLGILIALGGVSLIAFSKDPSMLGNGGLAAGLIMIATALYATSANLIRNKLAEVGSFEITALSLFFISFPALIVLFYFTDFSDRLFTNPEALVGLGRIFILSLTSNVIALVLYSVVIKLKGAVFASTSTYLIPIVATILGIADGEYFGWGHIAGALLILIGVYAINKK